MSRPVYLLLLIACTAMLAGGCRKDDPAPPAPPPVVNDDGTPAFELTTNGPLGFRMTIDGQVFEAVAGPVNTSFYFVDILDGLANDRYYQAGLVQGDDDDLVASMRIGTLQYPSPGIDVELFNAFFAPGIRAYGVATDGGQGVEIEYVDANGAFWSTRCGSGQQIGGTFVITDVLLGSDAFGPIAKVVAVFDGTLYSCMGFGTKQITEGGLVLEFRDM